MTSGSIPYTAQDTTRANHSTPSSAARSPEASTTALTPPTPSLRTAKFGSHLFLSCGHPVGVVVSAAKYTLTVATDPNNPFL